MASAEPGRPWTLLGGRSTEAFLGEHWQRRPLLVRQALPGITPPIEPDELAGLACEPEVDARLVEGSGHDWRVRYGPFEPEVLTGLGAREWTLLVTDVERHLRACRAVAQLLGHFDFLPHWRVDDLMLSLAAPGGSVGPHVDAYDVFLVQLSGHRHWAIGAPVPAGHRPHLVEDLPLAILAEFEPTEDWLLGPGDMLYLPPGVPHHGVAAEAPAHDWCMTASVGFRAPSAQMLITEVAHLVASAVDPEWRFSDPGRAPTVTPGALDEADLEGLGRLLEPLREALNDPQRCARLIAQAVTRDAPGASPGWAPETPDPDSNANDDTARGPCVHALARLAYCGGGAAPAQMYAGGEPWQVPPGLPACARVLCDHPHGIAEVRLAERLAPPATARDLARWLDDLIAAGHLARRAGPVAREDPSQ